MQVRHDRRPGLVPNLLPGELGVNLADRALYMWAQGHKAKAVPNELAANSPPRGWEGAPIVRTSMGTIDVDNTQAASSQVGGVIHVDTPPTGYALPGLSVQGAGGTAAMLPQTMRAEPFTIASDGFNLSDIVFRTDAAVPARLGIQSATGEVFLDIALTTTAGLNRTEVTLPLAPGAYVALLWVAQAVNVAEITALPAETGWTYVGGAPSFTVRRTGPSGDWSAHLPLAPAVTAERAASPGERRALAYRWALA